MPEWDTCKASISAPGAKALAASRFLELNWIISIYPDAKTGGTNKEKIM
jgi:hypothetical protein